MSRAALIVPADESAQPALVVLRDAWDEARNGSIVVQNIVGPPMSGKTALVDGWLQDIDARAVRSWLPFEPAATFRPVADVIEQLAGIEPSDTMDAARVKLSGYEGLDGHVLRRIAHLAGERGSVFASHELFWALRAFLAYLARKEPLVVVWEGVERAEPTFLDMLEYLAGRGGALLIVTTGREDLKKARPHWVGAAANPLRAATLTNSTGATDLLEPVETLAREHRMTLDATSVIGESLDPAEVAALLPAMSRDAIAAAVGRFLEVGLLVRRPVTRQDVSFSSGALRDVVRDQVSDRFAAAVHEARAAYLEGIAADRAVYDEMIAFHLESAIEHGKPRARKGLVDRAVRRLAVSGRRALARSDAPAAVDLLERGAVLIDDADTRRPRLLLSLCDALLDLGDVQRIRRIAETGLQEARDVDDDMAAARFGVWRQIAMARLRPENDLHPEREYVDFAEAVRIAASMERAGEHIGAAEAYQLYAEHLWDGLDYPGAEEVLEKALLNAQAANHVRLASKIAAWLMFSFFWGPRPAPSGIARCEALAGEFSADRLLEANRLTTLGGLYGLAGDYELARRSIAAGRAVQLELGQPLVISWNPQIGATVALVAGDVGGAEAEARLAFDEAQDMADPGHAATSASLLAKVLYAQDRLEEAFQYTRLAERASYGAPAAAQAEWRCTRAKLDARRGNVEAAVAEITGSLDFLDAHAMPRDRADALVDLADVLEMADRADQQRHVLVQALDLYERKGVVPAAERVSRRLEDLD